MLIEVNLLVLDDTAGNISALNSKLIYPNV